MADVQQQAQDSNFYDFFVETMDDINGIPSNESSTNLNSKSNDNNELSSMKITAAQHQQSRQSLLDFFVSACNQMSAMESNDNLVALSSANSLSSMDSFNENQNGENVTIFSFFKALENISAPPPSMNDLVAFQHQQQLKGLKGENTPILNNENNVFYDFFLKLESFLNNTNNNNNSNMNKVDSTSTF